MRDEFAYDLEELEPEPKVQYTGASAKSNYGPLTKGCRTVILAEGKDWLLVKNDGKAIYTYKWVVQK